MAAPVPGVPDGRALADALSPGRDRPRHEDAVALLREQSPIYEGRTAADAERLRGSLLVRLASTGLPAGALPFVVEDLATGQNPFAVASAARALRGSGTVPDGLVDILLGAVERMRGADDAVRLEAGTPGEEPSSALTELFRTLAWAGADARPAVPALERLRDRDPPAVPPAAAAALALAIEAIRAATPKYSCCSGRAARAAPGAAASSADLADVEVQDQDGAVSSLGAMAGARRSVMAFFYTRCANPEKCSLTITRLGALRRRLDAEEGGKTVNVLALTYDPGFDLPERLQSYGASRGLTFDERTRLLRTTGDLRPVVAALDLGVGYGPSTVNQHTLELAFLDAKCKVERVLRDALWLEDDVVAALRGDPMREGGGPGRS